MNISDQITNLEKKDDLEEIFTCNKCNYSTNIKNSWIVHTNTKKHQFNMTHEESYKRVEYYCECCNVKINHMNNWIKHVNSLKHKRAGKPKSIECKICELKFINHQTQKHHILSKHSTKEERAKEKYYCEICDYVFISKLYSDKHIAGKIHQNKIKLLGQ